MLTNSTVLICSLMKEEPIDSLPMRASDMVWTPHLMPDAYKKF